MRNKVEESPSRTRLSRVGWPGLSIPKGHLADFGHFGSEGNRHHCGCLDCVVTACLLGARVHGHRAATCAVFPCVT